MSNNETRPVIGPRRPFSNRKQELSLFRHLIEQGKDGSQIRPCILCYWGAHGIGKSRLLLQLQEQYHHRQPEFTDWMRKPAVARLDLARASILWKDGLFQREELVRELWRQLAQELELDVQPLPYGSPAEWAEHFVRQVTAWMVQDVTPVIILDTLDDLLERDKDSFVWLEEQIVERLALTNRLIFVFGSRRQLTTQWTRLQVKRRLLTAQLEQEYGSHLQVFDAAAIAVQVSAGAPASELLLRYTYGHPLYTEKMASCLEAQGLDLRRSPLAELQTALDECEPVILRELVKSILSQHLAEMQMILYLSVLRVLSLERVRALLERLQLVNGGLGDDYFLDFIYQLVVANLIQRDPNNKSLRIMETTLRHLFVRLLELDDRAGLLRAHEQLAEFFKAKIQQSHELFTMYLPELIYHRLAIYQLSSASAPATFVAQLMQDIRQMQTAPSSGEWCAAIANLYADQTIREMAHAELWIAMITQFQRNCTEDAPRIQVAGGLVWRQM